MREYDESHQVNLFDAWWKWRKVNILVRIKKCIYYLKNYLIFKKKRRRNVFYISKNTYYILEFNLQKFSLNFNIVLY